MLTQVFFVASVFALASADMMNVRVRPCTGSSAGAGTLHGVRVENCRNYRGYQNPCRMQRGSTPTVEIDFTPSRNLDSLFAKAYWRVNSMISLPWSGMDNNACAYLSPTPSVPSSGNGCNLYSSTRFVYSYSLPISRWVPGGRYPVKWTLQDSNSNNQVCFLIYINLL